jgi:hypothetical protein
MDAMVVSKFKRGSKRFIFAKVVADSLLWGSLTTTRESHFTPH